MNSSAISSCFFADQFLNIASKSASKVVFIVVIGVAHCVGRRLSIAGRRRSHSPIETTSDNSKGFTLLLTFCAAILLITSVQAQQSNTFARVQIGATSYSNITIRAISPVDGVVTFNDRAGGAKIRLRDLPPDIRPRFYNQSVADQFQADEDKKGAAAAEAKRVAQKHAFEIVKSSSVRLIDGKEVPIAQMESLDGEIEHVMPSQGGVIFRPYKLVWRRNRSDSMVSVGNFLGSSGGPAGYHTKERGEKLVFIKIDTAGLVDGSKVEWRAISVGTITLTNVLGATTTVVLYDYGSPYEPTK